MDVMAVVGSMLAAQTGTLQTKVAASIMKSNMDAEKSAVQALLGAGTQGAASLANVAAGIGGSVNRLA